MDHQRFAPPPTEKRPCRGDVAAGPCLFGNPPASPRQATPPSLPRIKAPLRRVAALTRGPLEGGVSRLAAPGGPPARQRPTTTFKPTRLRRTA